MPEIEPCAGRRPRIADPFVRAAYTYGISLSDTVYPPGTADWDQKDRQAILTAETAGYLYSAYTPLTLHYQHGSRPLRGEIGIQWPPGELIATVPSQEARSQSATQQLGPPPQPPRLRRPAPMLLPITYSFVIRF